MIFVDSSVWIDLFNARETPQTILLERLVGSAELIVGDLVLVEVLQGFDSDRMFARALDRMSEFQIIEIASRAIAVEAARNYRRLRALGITVRKTIDTLIATRCIADGYPLLFRDRDFHPFVEHLGLKCALA